MALSAETEIKDKRGGTPLLRAAEAGHAEAVGALLLVRCMSVCVRMDVCKRRHVTRAYTCVLGRAGPP